MSGDPLIRALGFLGLRGRPVLRSLLLGVGGALSALGLAALSAWLITRAWQMPPVLYLSVAITAVRALGISRGLFRYLERLATHDLALGAMASARTRVYVALASGSPAYSVTLRRGDLLTRTGDDIDEIGNALIRGLIPIGVGLTTSVAAVIIMALVSPWAALVLAVALLVSGVLAPWLAARGSARSIADAAAATTRSAEATTTALWHASELVVARRRDAVLAAASTADREAVAAADRGVRWQAAAAAATPLSLGASVLAACVIGIHLAGQVPGSLAEVSSGHGLTPMILGVLILLPLSAFESTAPLTEAGVQLETSRQSAARVMALVDGAKATGASDADVPVHDGPVTLHADQMRWGWPDSGLLGKSTALAAIMGLLAPDDGSVLIGSVPVVELEPDAFHEQIAWLPQQPVIVPGTVADNLELFGALNRVGLARAAAATGFDEVLAALPDGLDTTLGAGGVGLSAGQRQRLALTRVLASPSPLLLLDEPTAHLDAASEVAVLTGLRDRARAGDTVLIVAHRDIAREFADHLVDVGGGERCPVIR